MAFFKSKGVEEFRPAINASQNGDVRVVYFEYLVSTAITTGDVIGLCKLPAGHVPVDFYIAMPDLDTGAALRHNAGFYEDNGLGDTAIDDNVMFNNSGQGQSAGGFRMNGLTGIAHPPLEDDQIFALTIRTGPAGGGTSAIPIRGWFMYRPASYDN